MQFSFSGKPPFLFPPLFVFPSQLTLFFSAGGAVSSRAVPWPPARHRHTHTHRQKQIAWQMRLHPGIGDAHHVLADVLMTAAAGWRGRNECRHMCAGLLLFLLTPLQYGIDSCPQLLHHCRFYRRVCCMLRCQLGGLLPCNYLPRTRSILLAASTSSAGHRAGRHVSAILYSVSGDAMLNS